LHMLRRTLGQLCPAGGPRRAARMQAVGQRRCRARLRRTRAKLGGALLALSKVAHAAARLAPPG